MSVRFEWDRAKAAANHRKHRVTFEEAASVFNDSLAYIFDDEDHSLNERREIIIGHSSADRLLVVCFTERAEGVVRLFSARRATRRERGDYEENADFNAR
jgi:uncharacterized DUF497 family protein